MCLKERSALSITEAVNITKSVHDSSEFIGKETSQNCIFFWASREDEACLARHQKLSDSTAAYVQRINLARGAAPQFSSFEEG